MKIKLDENIPRSVVPALGQLGHDIDTVEREGLVGHSDAEVWDAAQAGRRFLITQDLDFSDIRKFKPGTHEGLLLLRLRLPGRSALAARLLSVFRSPDTATWPGCFVVATDRKIRVHRPKS